jgi:hypothetical protein
VAPTADPVASAVRSNPLPPIPEGSQVSCTAKPNGLPLAFVWPSRPEISVAVDLSDLANPRTLCTFTNIDALARFFSADEISYVIPRFGTTAKLVRTNVRTHVTETFLYGGAELWDWSRDGKTLAYFTAGQLWLKHQGKEAVSLASYEMQPGRGGGWIDELAIRFSPSGQYFVFVHTVTIPLTFEVRRTSDGAVVWSQPRAEFRSTNANIATKAVWARERDRLYFRDNDGVKTWDLPGTVTTQVPGLRWITTSMSPDGNSIAYTVQAQASPYGFHVAVLDLHTLQSRTLIADRVGAKFASDQLLLNTKIIRTLPGGTGVVAYDLKTGMETDLPYDQVIDVWPAGL